MLESQNIVIIRHAERGWDGITEVGSTTAIETGRVLTESVFREIPPNWIALFDWTSLRVQKTAEAIKKWMGLPANFPVHTLPLDGKYDQVSREEIWESGIIIRRLIADVWNILIVTNGQYIDKLANDLWKYWWLTWQERSPLEGKGGRLGYLWYIHWSQNLVWDIPQDALDVMWDDFGKSFSLGEIAEKLGKTLRVNDYDIELKEYMKQRFWYFNEHRTDKEAFQEITGIENLSNRIITFNPSIEQKDDDIVMTMPTREEYIAESTRASSYLMVGNKSFVHPLQWFRYRIGYHGWLFR